MSLRPVRLRPVITGRVIIAALGMAVLLGQAAAPLVVTVEGVREARGTIRVAVCPRENFLQATCPYVGHARAALGDVRVTIADIPPGTYAAQAFHDANDNQVLDRTLLGLPKEGMGFSNDAQFHFGPPAFADAAFSLTAEGGNIAFRLRYFDR